MPAMDYVAFDRGHLSGVLRLCEAEGWPTLPADPERAERALTAPGVITVVAVADGDVAGFAQMLTDGAIQAYLAVVAVAGSARGQGVGRRLVEEAFVRSGAQRVDFLALDDTEALYRAFAHRTLPGYRLYPGADPAT